MDAIERFSDKGLWEAGPVSRHFLAEGCKSFQAAREKALILLKANMQHQRRAACA